ncbi:MAG: hypothetical protein ACO3LH_09595 [Steroidobacteraceae bacterium]
MSIEVFSSDELLLLDAWFRSAPIDERIDRLLCDAGFEEDCEPYTRLAAWVGAFAVAEIQERLPNWTAVTDKGFQCNRQIRAVVGRRVVGLTRHLFTINWADSGPGFSWPVAYTLVWIPVFDRFVVTSSADGPDAFGYADFALGSLEATDSWQARVKELITGDWTMQRDSFEQAPWEYLFDAGAISQNKALAWREEVWPHHECEDEEEDDEDLAS